MNSNPVSKTYNFVKNLSGIIATIAITIMMFLMTANVITTNMMDFPLLGTYEFTQFYLMPLIVFPGLILTYDAEMLPKFDVFIRKGSLLFKKVINNATITLELVTNALLFYYGIQKVTTALANKTSITMGNNIVPLYVPQLTVPIGFLCVILGIIFVRYLKLQYVVKDRL